MRVLAIASCLSLATASLALAQDDGPLMPTPPPTDFTKPFQYDRAPFYIPGQADPAFVRGQSQDEALPVEVISRADLLARGNPTMEELVRELGGETKPAQTRKRQRLTGFPMRPVEDDSEPLPAHCYYSFGEPVSLGREISCKGRLIYRTPAEPGP